MFALPNELALDCFFVKMSLFLIQAISDYGSRSKMMPVFEKQ